MNPVHLPPSIKHAYQVSSSPRIACPKKSEHTDAAHPAQHRLQAAACCLLHQRTSNMFWIMPQTHPASGVCHPLHGKTTAIWCCSRQHGARRCGCASNCNANTCGCRRHCSSDHMLPWHATLDHVAAVAPIFAAVTQTVRHPTHLHPIGARHAFCCCFPCTQMAPTTLLPPATSPWSWCASQRQQRWPQHAGGSHRQAS